MDKKKRRTYREKRREDPTARLHDRVEALFYETIAQTLVKTGMTFTSNTPTPEFIDELRKTIRNSEGEIRAATLPMFSAIVEETRALGMTRPDALEAIVKHVDWLQKNFHPRRLRDTVERIRKEKEKPPMMGSIFCPYCLDPDEDGLPMDREFFEDHKCESPDCNHHHAYLTNACHPEAGLKAEYCQSHGVLTLACCECGEGSAVVQVAGEIEA